MLKAPQPPGFFQEEPKNGNLYVKRCPFREKKVPVVQMIYHRLPIVECAEASFNSPTKGPTQFRCLLVIQPAWEYLQPAMALLLTTQGYLRSSNIFPYPFPAKPETNSCNESQVLEGASHLRGGNDHIFTHLYYMYTYIRIYIYTNTIQYMLIIFV